MSKKAIVLYLHAHQPFRLRHYTVFDAAKAHNYFETELDNADYDNKRIIEKISHTSYIPTNRKLLDLLEKHPEFHLNLSLSGVFLEQLEKWAPDVLKSFQNLVKTGRVEIAAETYHHSLAFFYNREEFEIQVNMHLKKIKELFDQDPVVFRNTELAYNNDLAKWAEDAGFKGILAEGWDPVLGWKTSNFMYRPVDTKNIRLFLKNYKLSDDIAFRFSNRTWSEWPLTADKFVHWLNDTQDAEMFNLFMDYETFGEHQWEDIGIFEFLDHLPKKWLENPNNTFMTFSQAIDNYQPKAEVDMPNTVTWADTERDLTAWLGNPMQQQAIKALYDFSEKIIKTGDWDLIEDWRKLQTSDHFYYMCTKWFSDGDVHAYFSPYKSPYEGFINYMNTYQDLRFRLSEKGTEV
jgi:alpha-amylase